MGVPGPWSQAAKFVFEFKNIPFVAVAQAGAQANDELYDWTGHRNAPVAVYEDEASRAGWSEIILLAERLAPHPALLPAGSADRAEVFGLISELASEGGLAWQRRLQMIDGMRHMPSDSRYQQVADVLGDRYGHGQTQAAAVVSRCADILAMLSDRLNAQHDRGSDYFVGDGFTAADLYWACFSQLVTPMPHDQNPMRKEARAVYQARDPEITSALDPILLAHREMVYQRHLSLPLEF
jgi:glutathione S-transferase